MKELSAIVRANVRAILGALLMQSGAACYEYRAKNSFGAILPSRAMLTAAGKILLQEKDGGVFVNAWNRECAASVGDDITGLLKDAMQGGK